MRGGASGRTPEGPCTNTRIGVVHLVHWVIIQNATRYHHIRRERVPINNFRDSRSQQRRPDIALGVSSPSLKVHKYSPIYIYDLTDSHTSIYEPRNTHIRQRPRYQPPKRQNGCDGVRRLFSFLKSLDVYHAPILGDLHFAVPPRPVSH